MSTLRDETLSDLLKAFWLARYYLIVGGIIGFVLAAFIVIFAVPHMRSIMIVAPTSDISSPFLGESGQSSSTTKETIPFLRYLKILSGPKVVEEVLKQNNGLQSALENSQRFTFQSRKKFKTPEDISAYLSDEIVIKPIGDTPLRTIELEHPNPKMAQQLLLQLHETSDHQLRQEVLTRTKDRLSYLTETLAKTANPEHRQALTRLLMEQERQSMMIRMDRAYAATLVEEPFIYPKPVWPRKPYLFPIFVMIGMLCGWVVFGVIKTYETNTD